MVIRMLIGVLWIFSLNTGKMLVAQTLQLPYSALPHDSVANFKAQLLVPLQQSNKPALHFQKKGNQTLDILPDYVKKNPSGYSWLCRMELKIEDELPVGLWVKAGDPGGVVHSTGNNLHVKFKLFRF